MTVKATRRPWSSLERMIQQCSVYDVTKGLKGVEKNKRCTFLCWNPQCCFLCCLVLTPWQMEGYKPAPLLNNIIILPLLLAVRLFSWPSPHLSSSFLSCPVWIAFTISSLFLFLSVKPVMAHWEPLDYLSPRSQNPSHIKLLYNPIKSCFCTVEYMTSAEKCMWSSVSQHSQL